MWSPKSLCKIQECLTWEMGWRRKSCAASVLEFIRHIWCALLSTHRIQSVPFIGFGKSDALSQLSLTCFHFFCCTYKYTKIYLSCFHSSQSHRNWLSLIFLRYIAFVHHIYSLYQISQQASLVPQAKLREGQDWHNNFMYSADWFYLHSFLCRHYSF